MVGGMLSAVTSPVIPRPEQSTSAPLTTQFSDVVVQVVDASLHVTAGTETFTVTPARLVYNTEHDEAVIVNGLLPEMDTVPPTWYKYPRFTWSMAGSPLILKPPLTTRNAAQFTLVSTRNA